MLSNLISKLDAKTLMHAPLKWPKFLLLLKQQYQHYIKDQVDSELLKRQIKTIAQQDADYQEKMNECADLETELWEEFNKKVWHINNEHRIKRQEMEKSYQN